MFVKTEKVGIFMCLLMVCVFLQSTAQARPVQPSHKVCITMDLDATTEFRQELERLEDWYGLVPVIVLPPRCVIGYLNGAMITPMKADGRITVHNTLLSSRTELIPQSPEKGTDKILCAWNAFFEQQDTNRSGDKLDSVKTGSPLIDDIVLTDTDYRLDTWEKLTSEYLIGEVAIGIFLMESDGPIENWSNGSLNRSNSVWEKIITGLTWMHGQAMGRDVNIEFWFDAGGYHEAVPTGWEPITLSSMCDSWWIEDAMEYRGYGDLYDYLRGGCIKSDSCLRWRREESRRN